MTIADALVAHALAPLTTEDEAHLRTLTLFNIGAAMGEQGRAEVLLAALPLPTSIASDAFLFAARLHTRTQDDFLPAGRAHIGAVTLAVALALCNDVELELLDCLSSGYRVMGLLATTYGSIAQRRGLRPTGVFGPLGAAATAARALHFDRAQTAAAIALAAATSAGTNQAWLSGSDEWLLEVGAAARAGLEAALFVKAGAIAAPEAFEGAAGWSSAFFDDADAQLLSARLRGPSVSPIELVACKLYPVSGIAQVPTELARQAYTRLDQEPVNRVVVQLPVEELAYPGTANHDGIASRPTALMSVAFCVATALRQGKVPLATLEEPQLSPGVEILDRVSVVADAALPEGTSRITVDTATQHLVLEAASRDLLWPSWDATQHGLPLLATRCEVAEEYLRPVCDELARPVPSATNLRGSLATSRLRIGTPP